jgi:glutathione S-transferase
LAELQAFASYLASSVHVAHAHYRRGSRWADEAASHDDMKRKTPANMRACFQLIERELFRGPWAMGEDYSVIDPYLFTISGWLARDEVDIAEFPAIAEHFRRMSSRDSVRRVLEVES